ncbi:MAG: hypothetical protein Q8P20_08980, partial [bacterium]|nr:hypothetical protein [bacterium]
MDTSKEYITMCEKAVEIQELCVLERRDVFPAAVVNGVCIITGSWFGNVPLDGYWGEGIWLPRQDQLQAMIWDNYVTH